MGFKDFEIAAEMRDVIQHMIRTELERLRPEPRVAQVKSIDADNLRAEVSFAGDEGQFGVRFGKSLIPRDTNAIVRVGGTPGNYYITEILNQAGAHETYEPLNEAYEAGEFGTDGLAPDDAPIVTFIGGIGSLFFRWTEITNPDPVTYRLHVRAGSAPTTDGTYEVASGIGTTFATVRKLKDGTTVVADGSVTYYGVVSVEDADGVGPASTPVSGVPAQVNTADIAASAITADLLVANDAWVEALRVTDLHGERLVGTTVETRSEVDRGVKLGFVNDIEGLYVYDDAGNPFLTAVPSTGMAVVSGEVKTRSFTVSSDDPTVPPTSSLGGITEIATGGGVKLTAGTTAPASAPLAYSSYDSIQFAGAETTWATRKGIAKDSSLYYTVRKTGANVLVVDEWDSGGAFVDTTVHGISPGGNPWFEDVMGCAVDDTNDRLYVLIRASASPQTYWVYSINTATQAIVDWYQWTQDDGNRDPAIGFQPSSGDILIAQSRPSNADKVRIRRYTISGGSLVAGTFIDSDTGFSLSLSGVHYDGSIGYIFTSRGSGDLKVLGPTGLYQSTQDWPSGISGNKVGILHDGTNYRSMDDGGLLRTYTNITSTNANDMVKWVSSTLVQGATPTYETTQSPRAKVVMPKRSKLVVSASRIPSGSDADRINIYVGQGATDPGRTAMFKQTAPAVGGFSQTYTSLATSGTNPPLTNNFPNSAGSYIEATSLGFRVNHDSSGTPGTGLFAKAIGDLKPLQLRGAKIATQSIATGAPAATLVTFPIISYNQAMTGTTETFTVTSNNVFTIPLNGIYEIFVRVVWATNSTGKRSILINKNNATAPATTDSENIAGDNVGAPVTGPGVNQARYIGRLAAADTIRVWVSQTSGANLDIEWMGYSPTEIVIVRKGAY